jgi:NAD(P)-dependent dehydrogenase (short-subunit alcohol dehydrogenase family)
MIRHSQSARERPRGARVAGKVAIVTGAGGGIGSACAELLGKEGATVVVADRAEEAGRAVAERIVEDGGAARFAGLDVAREEECVRLVRETVEAHGRLDGLVNVAGIYPRATLAETTLELWREIMAVNLEGPFVLTREAVPHMVAGGGGSIVNIGSFNGLGGVAELAAYSVSKGGLLTLTRNVAATFVREGVRVNYLIPGWVLTDTERAVRGAAGQDEAWLQAQTERMPAGRYSTPEDVALTVLFLISDESLMVNGQIIATDAGSSVLPAARANLANRT